MSTSPSGISAPESSITGNTANGNTGDGISTGGGLVSQNVASNNTGFGLDGSASAYGANTFWGNNAGGDQVTGSPVEIGSNVCQGMKVSA